jgi:hypothetical protein
MNFKGIVAGLLLAIWATQTFAQDANSRDATASAIAYGEIAPGAAFDTLAQDDTELDANALERVNAVLAQKGHGVSREAELVMVVDMTLIRAEGQDVRTEVPRTGTDAPLGKGDNLFSSERSTMLNRREVPRSGHLLRLEVSVYERKSGLYLWRGQISRDGLDVTVEQAQAMMVPTLLEHLGRTLGETSVPLQ